MSSFVVLEEWETRILAAYGRGVPADTIAETQTLALEPTPRLALERVRATLDRYCGRNEDSGWITKAESYLAHTSQHAFDGWDGEIAKDAAKAARNGEPVEVLWTQPLPRRQRQVPDLAAAEEEPSMELLAVVAAGLSNLEEPSVNADDAADRMAATVDVLATAEEHPDEYVRQLAANLREQLAALESAIADAQDRKAALADLAAYRATVEARIEGLQAEIARLLLAGTEAGVRQWADEREMWPHETQPLPAQVIYAYLKDLNGD